jgi:hypothetical protein
VHILIMRTHEQIILDAGGYKALADKIGQPQSRVRFWQRRGSIPPAAWPALAERRVAGLRELAEAAAAKKAPHGEAVA